MEVWTANTTTQTKRSVASLALVFVKQRAEQLVSQDCLQKTSFHSKYTNENGMISRLFSWLETMVTDESEAQCFMFTCIYALFVRLDRIPVDYPRRVSLLHPIHDLCAPITMFHYLLFVRSSSITSTNMTALLRPPSPTMSRSTPR